MRKIELENGEKSSGSSSLLVAHVMKSPILKVMLATGRCWASTNMP